KKFRYLHRIIADAKPGQIVDHINGDTLDNRRSNLRLCTTAENNRNTRGKNPKSGFKGVYPQFGTNTWQAKITVAGKVLCLGTFKEKEDAAKCYDLAAREHFGEFARTNF